MPTPKPPISLETITRGITDAISDIALLEAMTGGVCFNTRAFLADVLLAVCRDTAVHATVTSLAEQVRSYSPPSAVEPRTLPAVWLATCEALKVDGSVVVLTHAWASEAAALAWRDRHSEALSALGFTAFTPVLVPVAGADTPK